VIEPTDEMVQAFTRHFFTCFRDQDVRDALAAVLAIVEKDVVPEAYGMGRDDEANDAPMAVTLDEINARRARPW